MYKIRIKESFLFLILTFSTIILILAFSAYLKDKYKREKPLDFIKTSYVQLVFPSYQKTPVKNLKTQLETDACDMMILDYTWFGVKAIAFTNNFFEEIQVNRTNEPYHNSDENVAIVNQNRVEELCYQEHGATYLYKQGVAYKVIGTYVDDKDDPLFQIPFYLSIDAKGLQDNRYYDRVILVPKETDKLMELEQLARDTYPNAEIGIMDGTEGFLSLADTQAALIGICGILLSMNCIGFLVSWILAQRQEVGVRRMSGATFKDIYRLIRKRFYILFFCAYVTGAIITELLFVCLRNTKQLDSCRYLFGTALSPWAVLITGACIWLIGAIVLESSLKRIKKTGMLGNIRGYHETIFM